MQAGTGAPYFVIAITLVSKCWTMGVSHGLKYGVQNVAMCEPITTSAVALELVRIGPSVRHWVGSVGSQVDICYAVRVVVWLLLPYTPLVTSFSILR